jgi:DNA-binding CsgD family transcriptional regulator
MLVKTKFFENLDEINRLRAKGATYRGIGEIVGINYASVYKYLKMLEKK